MTKSDIRIEARKLAESHKEMDQGTHIIKLFPTKNNDIIRLLEVSSSVATSGNAEPFFFKKDENAGINIPCSIILLSDNEWEDVKKNIIHLPAGWNISRAEDMLK